MKRFLRRLIIPLARDDLYMRVFAFLQGLLIGSPGVAMTVWGAAHTLGPKIQVLYWAVAILFMAWGGLLVSRCVLSAQSPLARFVDKHPIDGQGLDGVALVIAAYVPAAFITLVLNFFGVRGQRTSGIALGKGIHIARSPDSVDRPPT